jgi:hypothetical protein
MPYSLKFKIYRDYLEVDIKGERIPGKIVEEGIARWSEVAKICEKNGIYKILANMDINGKWNKDSAFKLVDSADVVGWRKDYKLALVTPTDDLYMDLMFSETAMVNRGYEMKLFRGKRGAKKWLLF